MAHAKKDTSKEPWTSNYPPLEEWLHKRPGNRCMWQQAIGGKDSRRDMVECWIVGGAPILVLIFGNGNGWNIFTCCNDSGVAATLADAEARIGLEGSALKANGD